MKCCFSYLLSLIILLLTGCSGPRPKPIIDAETELQDTARQLERLPCVDVTQVEYSTVTEQALAQLEPVVGMPFLLSGTALLTITQDLTKTMDASQVVDRETLKQISEAVKRYQIGADPLKRKRSSPADEFLKSIRSDPSSDLPRAFITQHKNGDQLIITWSREVMFYQDAQTGKLASKISSVQITGGDEFDQDSEASTTGFDIGSKEGIEQLNRSYSDYLERIITEGKQRWMDGINKLSSILAKDAVFTDGDNYYILKTPDDLGKYISSENLDDKPIVPFQLIWIDAQGNELAQLNVNFSLRSLTHQSSGASLLDLFNQQAEIVPQTPLFEIPDLIHSSLWGGKLSLSSNDDRYRVVQISKELEFVCWADALQSQALTNSKLVEKFLKFKDAQELVESTPLLCQLSYKGEPYAMVMRVDPKRGTIITTNLATGAQTTWEIDDIRYIQSANEIIYEADRRSERILNGHKLDQANDFRFQVHPDGSIDFYGYEGSATPHIK